PSRSRVYRQRRCRARRQSVGLRRHIPQIAFASLSRFGRGTPAGHDPEGTLAIASGINGAGSSGWAAANARTARRPISSPTASEWSAPLLSLPTRALPPHTAFCALPTGDIIYYPAAFTDTARHAIEERCRPDTAHHARRCRSWTILGQRRVVRSLPG